MKKFLLGLLIVLNLQIASAQCSYTGTPLTQAGLVSTFTIDANSNTITIDNVRSGQYVTVNVVKGFNYTFSVPDLFTAGVPLKENLTLLDANTNASVVPAAFSAADSGTSLNWTATFSGQIKVLLSKGSCVNDNTIGGTITMVLNTTTNTQDSEATFGTDNWVGHVYNYVGNVSPGGATSPATPSTTTEPFTAANYAGYYNVPTQNFNEGFGGNNPFPILSNGTVRTNISPNTFAVRYKMRSTKTGCYYGSFTADDGVRLYVDGVLIFSEWKDQNRPVFGNVLFYLNGNSDIIIDYYENAGGNSLDFVLTPFDGSANTITAPNPTTVCSGVVSRPIIGSAFLYNGSVNNPTIKYQWQSSTDNALFTNISGATAKDYTPPAITATTVAIVTYYRRVLTAVNAASSSCTSNSPSISITTSPGSSTVSGTISGLTAPCSGVSGQMYSIPATTGASGYVWSVPAGWTITAGQGTTSITVTVGTAGSNGNIDVNSTFSCGAGTLKTLAVTVPSSSVGGTLTGNQNVCSGNALTSNITIANRNGNILKWQKSSDAAFTTPVDIATTAQPLTPALAGTFTANTYIRAVVQNGSCAIAYSSSVLITVLTSVGGSAGSNQTICSGTQPTTLNLTGNTGTVIKWQKSLDAGFTTPVDITNTTTTLTGAAIGNLTATTYFRAVVQNGTCTTDNSTAALVTVNAVTAAGTLSSDQSICTGTQPADLSIAGNNGAIIKWQKSLDLGFTTPTDIANTTTTLTGAAIGNLTATTYFRAVVQNGVCAVANTNVITITISSTTWDGTSWNNGAPTITTTAFITGNLTLTADLFACSLTVSNNAVVNIPSGKNVTLFGKLTIDSGSSFTLNSNANLVQQTTVANSGLITVKRNSNALFRLDYTQWSSPVTGSGTLLGFSPATVANRFYFYNNTTNLYNAYASPSTTTFSAGQGYHIRMPNNWVAPPLAAASFMGVFSGVPNNGNYSPTLNNGGAGFAVNLVGNPYPSAIKIQDFVTANTAPVADNINGTLYFWRKTNNPAAPSYSTWAGGTFTQGTPTAVDPNGFINVGQGFLLIASPTGTNINFTNSMRIANNDNQFFRASNTNTDYNRIWLNASGTDGSFSQMAVGYINNATNGADLYDGKYFNDGYIALTSINNSEKYTIQSRALPFDNNDVVPLSFKANYAGDYTIAIDHVDGLFTGSSDIYLRDNLLATTQNLTSGSYTFASAIGTFDSRFELFYRNTLATNKADLIADAINVYKTNNLINITTSKSEILSVKIFDVRGRLLVDKINVNATQFSVDGAAFGNQVLIVKTTLSNGTIQSKKIVN